MHLICGREEEEGSVWRGRTEETAVSGSMACRVHAGREGGPPDRTRDDDGDDGTRLC